MELNQTRIDILKEYINRLIQKKDRYKLNIKYKEEIEKISPIEAFELYKYLVEEKYSQQVIFKSMKTILNNLIHAFEKIELDLPVDQRFYRLVEESNMTLMRAINQIKDQLVDEDLSIYEKKKDLDVILKDLDEQSYEIINTEEILFNNLEENMSRYEMVSIISSLHDKIKKETKDFISLDVYQIEKEDFYKTIGEILFDIVLLKYDLETVLIPKACLELDEDQWTKMFKESLKVININN